MNIPHKYVNVICAWANGEEIEFKHKCDNVWRLLVIKTTPNFNAVDVEWRIKPATIEYRIGYFYNHKSSSYIIRMVQKPEKKDYNTTHLSFIKWLTDWIEIEVDNEQST